MNKMKKVDTYGFANLKRIVAGEKVEFVGALTAIAGGTLVAIGALIRGSGTRWFTAAHNKEQADGVNEEYNKVHNLVFKENKEK